MADLPWKPLFGESVKNTMASVSNPTRVGLFVRVVRRPHGRMNPGTWWELTDGKGEFWQVPPAICIPTSSNEVNYDGPDPSVECALPLCTNRLRRIGPPSMSGEPHPQWCSMQHRALTRDIPTEEEQ